MNEDCFQICLNSLLLNNDVNYTENSMAFYIGNHSMDYSIILKHWPSLLPDIWECCQTAPIILLGQEKTTNCCKWVGWWQILWPPCEKMRVIESRSLEIPPLSQNNTVLAFINVVDYQMPGFEINPCRWTSVLWDSTNYLQRHLSLLTFLTSPHCQIPGVKLKCYVEKKSSLF